MEPNQSNLHFHFYILIYKLHLIIYELSLGVSNRAETNFNPASSATLPESSLCTLPIRNFLVFQVRESKDNNNNNDMSHSLRKERGRSDYPPPHFADEKIEVGDGTDMTKGLFTNSEVRPRI